MADHPNGPSGETTQSIVARIASLDPEDRSHALASLSSVIRKEVERLLTAVKTSPREPGSVPTPTDRTDVPEIEAHLTRHVTPDDAVGEMDTAERIGPYYLLEKLGAGGMGEVFLAEQVEPVRRKVALKVIKAGMDSNEVLARFEAERQTLALMEHPNIARVLDAGITQTGRPWFAMELVRGIAITEFCDAHRLSIEERLRLFMSVCRAIEHAHQRGVIHRDIKPGNVLVAVYDNEPTVKVIDFGLAKALQSGMPRQSLVTHFGEILGTPEYMSPEQCRMDITGVDTRTDVYSLGVLLYELLTGSTPIDFAQLRQEAWDNIVRIIREQEPVRPSTRLRQSGVRLRKISETRSSSMRLLSHAVRGDLDWVTMKAIEKDKSRRYGSPSELAMDVQRFLNDLPVEARAPTFAYQVRKIIRRHRKMSAAIFSASLMLAITFVTIFILLVDTRRERDRANTLLTENRELAEDEARQRTAAQRILYLSNVALAAERQREGLTSAAMALMAETSAEFHNWEYQYVQRSIDQSLEMLELPLSDVAVVVQPEKQLVVISSDLQSVRIEEGRVSEAKAINVQVPRCDCAAVSPSGRILAIGSDSSDVVSVRDLTRNTNIGDFKIPGSGVSSLVLIDDVTIVAGDQTGSIHFLDTSSGAVEKDSLGDLWVTNLTSVPSAGCLVLNLQSQLVCWDQKSKKARWTTSLSGQSAVAIVVSESLSQVIAATEYGNLLAVSLETGEVSHQIDTGVHPTAMCLTSQDKTLLLANEDGHISVFETSTLTEQGRRQGHTGPIIALVPGARDNEFMSFAKDATCRTWSLETRCDLLELEGHSGPVTSITFSPAGSLLASGGYDRSIRLWDLTSNNPKTAVKELIGHTHYIRHLVFANEGRVLFSTDGDGHLFAWDVASQTLIDRFDGHDAMIYGLDLSPDGRTLVSGDNDGTLRIWDLTRWRAGTQCDSRTLKSEAVSALRFSDDGGQLISVHNDNVLRVWDTLNWNLVKSIKISSFTYALSDQMERDTYFLGGEPKGILEHVVVESGTSSLGHRLQNGQIYEFAANADRSRLFSACYDHTIKVFSVPDNRQVISLRRMKPETPGALTFSDRYGLLGAGYMDGVVCVWGDLRPLMIRGRREIASDVQR